MLMWLCKQETVFRHDAGKNSASNLDKDVKPRSKSSSAVVQQQAANDALTSSNCDASGDSGYDQPSGLSPWHVTNFNCAGNSTSRITTQASRSTTAFPLTTELWTESVGSRQCWQYQMLTVSAAVSGQCQDHEIQPRLFRNATLNHSCSICVICICTFGEGLANVNQNFTTWSWMRNRNLT